MTIILGFWVILRTKLAVYSEFAKYVLHYRK